MRNTANRWAKRLIIYFGGLFILAIGVIFSSKSDLGVSPVTCMANVVHKITNIELGVCTTLTYSFYVLIEAIILRRKFKITMLLHILASIVFGTLVTLAGKVMAFLPLPTSYVMQMVYLLVSIPIMAFGIMMYLASDFIPTSGDGLVIALSTVTKKPVPTCKVITDCGLVTMSALLSLSYFHGFVGVREGTVICALFVGTVLRFYMKLPINAFLKRNSDIRLKIRNELI